MNAPVQVPVFSTANPHALATILEASETKSIIASRDIFDIAGTKLWARNQPVSQALQRKLMDRQLRQPLETCLYAEDGVTGKSLIDAVEALLARDTPLTLVLKRYGDKLAQSAPHIALHPVAQLLLTAGQASRPESFEHAVEAMALCGALMLSKGGDTRELRQAMLCGLLHDLGEMYIAPEYGEADANRELSFQSYQHLVVHPHVGRLLIEQLTNYPHEVARAVGEHHERLDGSGYPYCLQRDQVTPLGRLLAVAEAALGTLRGEQAHLARASVALRAVPGEFDLSWVGLISYSARAQPPLQATLSQEEIESRLMRLDVGLQLAQNRASAMLIAAESDELKDALVLATHLLTRLRTGFNASGLWSRGVVAPQDCAEVEAVEDELVFRLHAIKRAVMLRAGELDSEEKLRLEVMCDGLDLPKD